MSSCVSSEEIQRLRERDEARMGPSPGAERRMEQWRREVGRELSSLRGHITRATSLGNLEERCIMGGAAGGADDGSSSRVKNSLCVSLLLRRGSEGGCDTGR